MAAASRVVSKARAYFTKEHVVEAPPDGGLAAWLVVLGCFTLYCITVGLQYTGGLLYRALLTDPAFAQYDRGVIAWVVSIENCNFLAGSYLAGMLVPRIGIRGTVMLGALLLSAGFWLSAVVEQLPALFFTYGILVGFGCSLPMSAGVISVSQYWSKRRATATGVAVSGSGFGALCLGPVIERMISAIGWRGAVSWLAVVACVLLSLSALPFVPLVVRPKEQPPAPEPDAAAAASAAAEPAVSTVPSQPADLPESTASVETAAAGGVSSGEGRVHLPAPLPSSSSNHSAGSGSLAVSIPVPAGTGSRRGSGHGSGWRSAVELAHAAAPRLNNKQLLSHRRFTFWLMFAGVYGACWFIVMGHFITFTREQGTSSEFTGTLVVLQGAANSIGRALLGAFADRVKLSKLLILQLCVAAVGVCTVLLSVVGDSFAYQCIYMLINGAFGGSIVSLQAPITVDLVGVNSLPLAQGWFNLVQAPLVLTSPPAAGWTRDALGDYKLVWVLAGCGMLFSSLACSLIVGLGAVPLPLPRRVLERIAATPVSPAQNAIQLHEDKEEPPQVVNVDKQVKQPQPQQALQQVQEWK